jgi:hypothetical protein
LIRVVEERWEEGGGLVATKAEEGREEKGGLPTTTVEERGEGVLATKEGGGRGEGCSLDLESLEADSCPFLGRVEELLLWLLLLRTCYEIRKGKEERKEKEKKGLGGKKERERGGRRGGKEEGGKEGEGQTWSDRSTETGSPVKRGLPPTKSVAE